MDEHPTSQILKDLLLGPLSSEDLERERAEADSTIGRLLSGGKIGNRAKLRTWGLCERLQERSWELRQKSPTKMVDLANRAVEVAKSLDPQKYGPQNVADLSARAWAGLANAYRIADQLSLAEMAFRQAFAARRQGTGSPVLQARLAECVPCMSFRVTGSRR